MIVIKISNCVHQDRRNQNTTFIIWKRDYSPLTEDEVTEGWVMENIELIKPKGVETQKNTSVKILSKRT